MMLFDPTFILILPAMILALYAQNRVTSTFQKYSRVRSGAGISGSQAARRILDTAGLTNVAVELTEGTLSDHYDPRTKKVRLSRDVYQSSSLAALGVAAHEVGHAIQDARGYVPLQLRSNLFPVASIGTQMAFPLFFVGLIFAFDALMLIGIWFFIAALVFQVVTLPVEFNASARAIQLLQGQGMISGQEVSHTKAVLNAAALTYVAAVAVSAMHLLRLLVLRGSRR